MNKRVKYDAEYISYLESGESATVTITRDIVNSINTTNKWAVSSQTLQNTFKGFYSLEKTSLI